MGGHTEGGLVTDGGGNTTEKGGQLGTGLGEPENVVDEQQDVLTLLVTEVFGDGESGQGDTGTGTWGFVHLSEHEGGLGLVVLELDYTGLDHLVVEIVTLTGSLSNTGENGVTTVGLGDLRGWRVTTKPELSDPPVQHGGSG